MRKILASRFTSPRLRLFLVCGLLSFGCGFAGSLIAASFHHAPELSDLKAQRVELVDREGRIRAAFHLDSDDQPSLDLFDQRHHAVAMLGVDGDRPHLRLQGSTPSTEARLDFQDGKPFLGFSGDGWEGRVIVGYIVDDDSVPSESGHWGLSVTGWQHRYSMALGTAMFRGQDYGVFATLPANHTQPLRPRTGK